MFNEINMYYLIYKTTNNINGKKYIGKHITENINDKYFGSGLYLINAIKKYGKENFTKEILFIFDNEEEMNKKERELVDKQLIDNDEYYNISLGGQGGVTVLYEDHPNYKEVCLKISNSHKKRSKEISDTVKNLHKQKKVGMYGKKQSEESIKKQRDAIIKTLTAEGYILPNTGRKASSETLQRMSIALKNRPKKTCIHCNKTLDPGNYARYHDDRCKHKPS